jgi:hypothetical protein
MGFLDRLFGRRSDPGARAPAGTAAPSAEPETLTDEQALERYRYLVRTAPPDAIEQAHEQAFEALTPEQRRQALQDLSAEVPEEERATDDDPRSLARMATRAEVSRPGTVERAFGGGGGVLGGAGGLLLTSFAGAFVGTAIAQSLWGDFGGEGDGGGEADQSADADAGGDSGDAGADAGDAGGDFGGGDFGGGDFGGGDVGGF